MADGGGDESFPATADLPECSSNIKMGPSSFSSSCANVCVKSSSQAPHMLTSTKCSCLGKDKENVLVPHEIESIPGILQELVADIITLEEKVKELSCNILPKLSEKQEEFEKEVGSMREKINKIFHEMREAIDEREEALLKELEAVYDQKSAFMSFSAVCEVEKALDVISSGREALEWVGIKERGAECVARASLVRSETEVIDELICKASTALGGNSIPRIEFRYDEGAVERVKMFGCVESIKSAQKVRAQSEGWSRVTLRLYGNDLWELGGDVWNYEIWMRRSDGSQGEEYRKVYDGRRSVWTAEDLLYNTSYDFRVCARDSNGNSWSEEVTVKTGNIEALDPECCWRPCPDDCGNDVLYDGDKEPMYHVDKRSPRIATKVLRDDFFFSTIPGSVLLPSNKVVGWGIRILKSASNNGDGISVGVAPADIDISADDNYERCGWYFDCYNCALTSGPPHDYGYPGKAYGPEGLCGRCVQINSVVYVVMNTEKGELAFIVNGVNYGTAFSGIPLDKPLVPCVILGYKGDCIELI